MAGVRGWALRWKEILLGSEALPGPLDQGREMNGDGEGPHIRPFLAEFFFSTAVARDVAVRCRSLDQLIRRWRMMMPRVMMVSET